MYNPVHEIQKSFQGSTQETLSPLENSSKLLTLRQQIIIEEREKIAAELHDDLAQTLTYILSTTSSLRFNCKQKQLDDIADQLSKIEETSRDLLNDLRLTILGLKVVNNIDPGFINAIQNFTTRFSLLAQVPIYLKIDPQIYKISLDRRTELQLFRILQEALVNIQKHANASQAWVDLGIKDDDVYFLIKDNGSGFDIEKINNSEYFHFGISTMNDRANSINASFKINSQIGSGTLIKVTLPKRRIRE